MVETYLDGLCFSLGFFDTNAKKEKKIGELFEESRNKASKSQPVL